MQGEEEVKWENGYFMEILQRELVWPKEKLHSRPAHAYNIEMAVVPILVLYYLLMLKQSYCTNHDHNGCFSVKLLSKRRDKGGRAWYDGTRRGLGMR